MKKAGYRFHMIFGVIGIILLFILNFCYIFVSIGLLTLGLISLPSALLGMNGIISVSTDLSETSLVLISSGILILGAGMFIGIFNICPASYECLKRFIKKSGFMRKRVYDEE